MSESHVARLRSALAPVLDDAGFLAGAAIGDRYCLDWGGVRATPLAVLRPRTPDEVAAMARVLHGLGQPMVVQGGMTGLVGAALARPGEVVISMERLRRIDAVDAAQGTVVCEAGVPLAALQAHAEAAGWLFPVDIGSRGSCQIGGIISTNAGGNRVLRYGMTRQSVRGIEAVLADGTVVSRMGPMLKDNAGYDLRQLFVGSEGTLGIVTRARLALEPLPSSRHTAMVTLGRFEQVIALLQGCRRTLGPLFTSFEVMWRDYYDLVTTEVLKAPPPFAVPGAFFVLVEAMGNDAGSDAARFEAAMEKAIALGEDVDVVIARSGPDAARLWAIRDASGEAANKVAPWFSFDISMPLDQVTGWVDEVRAALARLGIARTQTYGHLGDGNMHMVIGPMPEDPARQSEISRVVHAAGGARGGSISGEHGVGTVKRDYLAMTRSAAEIALMRTMKHALDPQNLLAPGRILPD